MNLKNLTITALIMLVISCKNNSEKLNFNETEKNDTIETEQNKLTDFGTDYTQAWNSQKAENVAAFFAESGSLIVNNRTPLIGREAITEFVHGFMTAYPDMKLTMDSLVFKPKETHYHWSFIGTNTGLNGTGNKVVFNGFERWTFNENVNIKLSIGSFDDEDYGRQVNRIISE